MIVRELDLLVLMSTDSMYGYQLETSVCDPLTSKTVDVMLFWRLEARAVRCRHTAAVPANHALLELRERIVWCCFKRFRKFFGYHYHCKSRKAGRKRFVQCPYL